MSNRDQPTGYYNPETGEYIETVKTKAAMKRGGPAVPAAIGIAVLLFLVLPLWIAIIHSAARRAETREGIAKEEQIESDPESEQGSVTDTAADNTKTDAEVNEKPEPESEPEPGSPAWNRAYIDSHKNEVIAAAKLSMDASGEEYSFPSLASQDWTIVMFDDSAVAAASDIRFRGKSCTFFYVCTLHFNEAGKLVSTSNHHIEADGIILYTDGYCDDVFDVMLGRQGNPEIIDGAYVKEGYDPDGSYMAAIIRNDVIDVYWMENRGQTIALYWSGTFVQPSGTDEYSFDSVNNTEKTASSVLASNDPSKSIRVKNGTISFDVAVSGEPTTIRMVPWENGIS